jgi:predicted  nucleic acid-binding Zn-ribbon protein
LAEGRVNSSNDIVAALSARVAELAKRVTQLQADLEVAQRRAAIYEEYDATAQEALASALRAAYEIRERAETTASQILEQAREERRMLLKEIERLREDTTSCRTTSRSSVAARSRPLVGPSPPMRAPPICASRL